jgi:hypothetical protein
MHVRFDERKTHFFHRSIHIRFRELAATAQLVKDLV